MERHRTSPEDRSCPTDDGCCATPSAKTNSAAVGSSSEVGNEEISWAMARGISADRYPSLARRDGRRPVGGVEAAASTYESYARLKRKTRGDRLRRRAARRARRRRARRRVRRHVALAVPPSARRRSPGPQPGAAPTRRPAPPRSRRRLPRRRPRAGGVRLQRRRSFTAHRGRIEIPRRRRRPTPGQPPVYTPDRASAEHTSSLQAANRPTSAPLATTHDRSAWCRWRTSTPRPE